MSKQRMGNNFALLITVLSISQIVIAGDKVTVRRNSDESGFVEAITESVKTTQANQVKQQAATEALASNPNDENSIQTLKQVEAEQKAITAQRDAGVAKYPNSLPVMKAATEQAVQAGDWNVGKGYADRAVSLAESKGDKKELASVLATRAQGELNARDYEHATADAARALKINPNDKNALSIYHTAKGRTSGVDVGNARPTETQAMQNAPSVDTRVTAAGEAAANHFAAINQLKNTLRYINAQDGAAALAAAKRAQALEPNLADAAFQQGLSYVLLKDLANALIQVSKAIELWTAQQKTANLPAAYSLRSQIQHDLNNPQDALKDADSALGYNRDFASALRNRARARLALGLKDAQTMEDYKRAAELDPGFNAEYAQLLRQNGNLPVKRNHLPWLFSLIGLTVLAFIYFKTMPVAPQAPKRIDLESQFELQERIGEGGMGFVFKALDKTLKRPVAIKKLRSELQLNERERKRFIEEAEMVASLRHPNIVEIYNVLHDDTDTYLIFEYIKGQTVHQLAKSQPDRRLDPAKAIEILQAVSEAVDYAHDHRVIHRDLKPANVMISDDGWIKVMDFGIARQVQDMLLTMTKVVIGTPVYMSPEQSMGAVVKESDIYALGVMMYEMLTGTLPFTGPNEASHKLDVNFISPSVIVPQLPASLDEVFKKVLASHPNGRYHKCKDFYKAVLAALDSRVTRNTPGRT